MGLSGLGGYNDVSSDNSELIMPPMKETLKFLMDRSREFQRGQSWRGNTGRERRRERESRELLGGAGSSRGERRQFPWGFCFQWGARQLQTGQNAKDSCLRALEQRQAAWGENVKAEQAAPMEWVSGSLVALSEGAEAGGRLWVPEAPREHPAIFLVTGTRVEHLGTTKITQVYGGLRWEMKKYLEMYVNLCLSNLWPTLEWWMHINKAKKNWPELRADVYHTWQTACDGGQPSSLLELAEWLSSNMRHVRPQHCAIHDV